MYDHLDQLISSKHSIIVKTIIIINRVGQRSKFGFWRRVNNRDGFFIEDCDPFLLSSWGTSTSGWPWLGSEPVRGGALMISVNGRLAHSRETAPLFDLWSTPDFGESVIRRLPRCFCVLWAAIGTPNNTAVPCTDFYDSHCNPIAIVDWR